MENDEVLFDGPFLKWSLDNFWLITLHDANNGAIRDIYPIGLVIFIFTNSVWCLNKFINFQIPFMAIWYWLVPRMVVFWCIKLVLGLFLFMYILLPQWAKTRKKLHFGRTMHIVLICFKNGQVYFPPKKWVLSIQAITQTNFMGFWPKLGWTPWFHFFC